jgi:competence protein ComEA
MKLSPLGAILLATVLTLPVLATAQTPSAMHKGNTPPPASSQAVRPVAPNPSTAQGKLVDINTASATELDALPGIGKARADAIIKNRPYRGKDDLATRRIVPQNVYDGIKDKIVARQG